MNSSSSPQGGEVLVLAQQPAQDIRELVDHRARLLRVGADQRRDGVQRIEQEVRIDLVAKRVHARLQQQPPLLFELGARCGRCSRS